MEGRSIIFCHFLECEISTARNETPPNRCTVIISSFRSPFGHQRNCKGLQSSGTSLTWWDMVPTTAKTTTASCWKQVSTPTREFVRSSPCKSLSFKELPQCLAEELKTVEIFPGLAGWKTAWRGRYQVVPGIPIDGAFFACPFWRRSCIQAMYFTCKSESFNRHFFINLSLCSTRLLLFSRQGG